MYSLSLSVMLARIIDLLGWAGLMEEAAKVIDSITNNEGRSSCISGLPFFGL